MYKGLTPDLLTIVNEDVYMTYKGWLSRDRTSTVQRDIVVKNKLWIIRNNYIDVLLKGNFTENFTTWKWRLELK